MLDDIEIWNDNQQTWYIQGWKNLKIQVSTNNGTSASDWTRIYDGGLPPASGAGAAPSSVSLQGLTLGGVPARYVTIINTGLGCDASWAPQFDGGNAALAEVRFLEQGEGEPDVKNATFKGTGSFTSGDGGVQTLYDPQGWDPDTYWYRVVPIL